MRREGYVRGQQAEVLRVGCQVCQEVVQSEIRAFGVLVDAEGRGEAVQEVQPVERAGGPQHAVAQLCRTDRGGVRQRVVGVEDRVHRFEPYQTRAATSPRWNAPTSWPTTSARSSHPCADLGPR